jgi:hypothetical protein
LKADERVNLSGLALEESIPEVDLESSSEAELLHRTRKLGILVGAVVWFVIFVTDERDMGLLVSSTKYSADRYEQENRR